MPPALPPTLARALARRAQTVERRVNQVRFGLFLLFGLLDLRTTWKEGAASPALLLTEGAGLLLLFAFFLFIHRMTSAPRPRPWVAYLTSTFDILILWALGTFYLNAALFPVEGRILPFLFLPFFLFLIVLNALRAGQGILLYNVLLSTAAALSLLRQGGHGGVVLTYIALILVLTGGLTLWIGRNVRILFLQVQRGEMLRRFLPQEAVERVEAGEVDLAAGGDRREVTLLLADLRGFTTLAEGQDPEAVVALLNRFLAAASEEIHRFGGSIDKYMGDGILAVFGLVGDSRSAARRAVAASEGIQRAVAALNAERSTAHLEVGIALHTGEVVVGAVGSPQRMDYTVIGDPVNVVARIEPLNKRYGTRILLSEATRERLGDAVATRFVDEVALRGRSGRVRLYTRAEPRPSELPLLPPPSIPTHPSDGDDVGSL